MLQEETATQNENIKVINNFITKDTDELKKKNIWVYAADMDGQRWDKTDFSGGACLVVGNEGDGVGRLIKEKCDVTVSLPMLGKVNSLNASVAASITMWEMLR